MSMKSVLTLCVLASTLFSATAQADSDSNFLLGLEGGYARQKTNFITGYTAQASIIQAGISVFDNQTVTMSDDMLLGGILGGWQWRCNRTMLGLEGNVDFHTLLRNQTFIYSPTGGFDIFQGTADYDRGIIFALTARAGYFVTSGFMPYVRAGAQVSRDQGSYQVFTDPHTARASSDFVSSDKEDIWGVVAGVGVEFPAMIGPSTVRVEYTFNRTESIVIEDGMPPIIGTVKFRYPQTNALKLAWVWNFL